MLVVSPTVDWYGMSFGFCTMLYSLCRHNDLPLKAEKSDQLEGQTKLHPRHTAPLKGEEQWLNYCVEYLMQLNTIIGLPPLPIYVWNLFLPPSRVLYYISSIKTLVAEKGAYIVK